MRLVKRRGRRRRGERGCDESGEAVELGFVSWKRLRVASRELGDLLDVERAIRAEQEMSAVLERSERSRSARKQLEAMIFQSQVMNDLRSKQAIYVGRPRELVTGNDLFGYRAAAYDGTTFEHQDFLAGVGQVGGCEESIVAGAEDDGIPGAHER